MKFKLRSSARQDVQNIGLIFLIGVLIYSNSLRGEFVSDDHVYIADSRISQNFGNIPAVRQFYYTRFVVGLTFAANYFLHGFNVFGYHLVNLILHLVNSLLVYSLVVLTFETPYLKKIKPLNLKPSHAAFFTSLIFLVHPIQTQAVSYISQRFTLMAAMFYLLTLVFYIKNQLTQERRYLILSWVSFGLGLFSKEMAMTAFPAILIYGWFFLKPGIKISLKDLKGKDFIPFYAMIAVYSLLLAFDKYASVSQWNAHINLKRFDLWYLFTEINVLRTYLRLLVLPIDQNHNYDYPVVQNIFDGEFLFSLLLLIVLTFGAVRSFNKERLLSFCVVWFFVALSVETMSVVFGNRGVIYEHWLYLPMVGFALFLVIMISKITKDKVGFKGLLIVIIVFMGLAAYNRNKIWRTETGLWQDVADKAPNSSFAYFALGVAYERKENFPKAKESYEKAISLKPDDVKAHSNLAVVLYKMGDDPSALKHWKRAIALEPSNPVLYKNLGYFYYEKNDCVKALEYYHKAVELKVDHQDVASYIEECQKCPNCRK